MKAFLEITGDSSPIHCNNEFAITNGYEGHVVYGMLTASFYSTLVGVYLPGTRALLHSINSSFHKPVYVAQELLIKGEVVYISREFKQIEIKAKIFSLEKGHVFSKAKIKVGIRG